MISLPLDLENTGSALFDDADINSKQQEEEQQEEGGVREKVKEKTFLSSVSESDMHFLDPTSFQCTDVGSERSRTAPGLRFSAPESPSPLHSAAPSAIGNGSAQGSSPQLVAAYGQSDRIGSAGGNFIPATSKPSRTQRPKRGSLMPPLPSPSSSRSEFCSVVDQDQRRKMMFEEGKGRELQQTLYENEELRRELGNTRVSLQQALRMLELREMECVELNQLVDLMQAGCKKAEKLDPGKPSSCEMHQVTNNSNTLTCASPLVISTSVDMENAAHCNGFTRLPAQLDATNASSSIREKDDVTLKIGTEYDRLVKELAQLKVVVAEQYSVLDRLGLRYPYTTEMIGAARVIIPRIKLLEQK